jgi:hypothetical protein
MTGWSVLGGIGRTKATGKEAIMERTEQSEHLTSRRSFLVKGAAFGAATLGGGQLMADASPAFASGGLTVETRGDRRESP